MNIVTWKYLKLDICSLIGLIGGLSKLKLCIENGQTQKWRTQPRSKIGYNGGFVFEKQNFYAFVSLCICESWQQQRDKKCKQNFIKNPYFLCVSYVNCWFKGSFEVSIWQRHTHRVFLETIWLMKISLA